MQLEHVNIVVKEPKASAKWMCDIFDWDIRWEGAALNNGYTVHVGSQNSYIALYRPKHDLRQAQERYVAPSLAHIGIVVDNLSKVEARIKALGFVTHSHADYEPGQRFYFEDDNGIEFEIVSYS